MLTVHKAPSLLILSAILTLTSSSMSSNYEDLESMATSHSHRFENGGGASEWYTAHKDEAGDHADRGRKSYYHLEEAMKGHHDMDKGHEHYSKDGAAKKNDGHSGGYHDEHHKGVEGGKSGGFLEKGNYGKGQSTHGEHEVKRLDEYKKIKEFHEEDYDSNFDKHESGDHDERDQGKGGYYKGGILDHDEHEADYGKNSHYGKGQHHTDRMGHSGSSEHEDRHENGYGHGEKVAMHDESSLGYKNDH